MVDIIDFENIDFETSEKIKIPEETLVKQKLVETVHKREIKKVYKKH